MGLFVVMCAARWASESHFSCYACMTGKTSGTEASIQKITLCLFVYRILQKNKACMEQIEVEWNEGTKEKRRQRQNTSCDFIPYIIHESLVYM